jgi:hypothetical protein
VILVDANLLVYAFIEGSREHGRAVRWLDEQINQTTRVGLPWPSLLAFLRLTTNPRIFSSPPTLERAWQQVREWLQQDSVWVPQPTAAHAEVLERILPATGGLGTLVQDAHLAALALEHGLIVCSSDGDFARFEEIRWWNPIADPEGRSIR